MSSPRVLWSIFYPQIHDRAMSQAIYNQYDIQGNHSSEVSSETLHGPQLCPPSDSSLLSY